MAKKGQKIEAGEEEVFEESGESRVYELGFHLDPELASDEVKKAYKAVREFVAGKGTLLEEAEPEKIQLAYTISLQETSGRRDFNSAYFSWIVYEASPEDHAEVVTMAGNEKRIIRFIDLSTTKEAARHAAEVKEMSLKAPEKVKESEEATEEEIDAALEHAVI